MKTLKKCLHFNATHSLCWQLIKALLLKLMLFLITFVRHVMFPVLFWNPLTLLSASLVLLILVSISSMSVTSLSALPLIVVLTCVLCKVRAKDFCQSTPYYRVFVIVLIPFLEFCVLLVTLRLSFLHTLSLFSLKSPNLLFVISKNYATPLV